MKKNNSNEIIGPIVPPDYGRKTLLIFVLKMILRKLWQGRNLKMSIC